MNFLGLFGKKLLQLHTQELVLGMVELGMVELGMVEQVFYPSTQ